MPIYLIIVPTVLNSTRNHITICLNSLVPCAKGGYYDTLWNPILVPVFALVYKAVYILKNSSSSDT